MLKGIDTNQTIEFSSSKDKEPKTIFVLKPLTGFEMLEATQKLGGETSVNIKYIEVLLEKAVVGIKNPNISDKSKVNEYIEGLNSLVLMEIATEIASVNMLSDDESKN